MALITQASHYVLLIFGFGFVIFFHELGHFLAAKYADVKVEQFALGFGPAVFSWRKGIGIRWGSTNTAYNQQIEKHVETQSKEQTQSQESPKSSESQEQAAAKSLGLGETEYRLNWVPLGGYVKMLGQDDLQPGVMVEDPRAYNNKSIRARMLIVSAGVIMNVILAALLYMGVYMVGYPCPPARAGSIASNAPVLHAMRDQGGVLVPAPLQEGDEILTYNGHDMHQDFSKVAMWVALTGHDEPVKMGVRRRDGRVETLTVVPKLADPSGGLPSLGLTSAPAELLGGDAKDRVAFLEQKTKASDEAPKDCFAVLPGDVITQINGQDVQPHEAWKLDDAFFGSSLETAGKPVDLTIKTMSGQTIHEQVWPHFAEAFDHDQTNNYLGLVPRAMVQVIDDKSPARGKLRPNDVIIRMIVNSDVKDNPTVLDAKQITKSAGQTATPITFVVLSDGDPAPHEVADINPTANIGNGKRGVGIGLHSDEQHTVVGEVQPGSSTDKKVKAGDTITAINGSPVSNWFQVRYLLAGCVAGKPVNITVRSDDGKESTVEIPVTQADLDNINAITVSHDLLPLRTLPGTLVTHNPLKAMYLGVIETRDLILQFYVTLNRMATGGIPLGYVMGPVGIFNAGASFADRGNVWLIWFLAMISANLAVVNFLPIPIVDGGLFAFLVLEKIQGRPLSQQTQKVIQMVGLALILGVFLLVTYGDITRHLAN